MLLHAYVARLLLSIAVVDAFTKLEVTDYTLRIPLRRWPVNLVKRDVAFTSLRKAFTTFL
jgi:hypothetical protein